MPHPLGCQIIRESGSVITWMRPTARTGFPDNQAAALAKPCGASTWRQIKSSITKHTTHDVNYSPSNCSTPTTVNMTALLSQTHTPSWIPPTSLCMIYWIIYFKVLVFSSAPFLDWTGPFSSGSPHFVFAPLPLLGSRLSHSFSSHYHTPATTYVRLMYLSSTGLHGIARHPPPSGGWQTVLHISSYSSVVSD